jgi:hypothetical protein
MRHLRLIGLALRRGAARQLQTGAAAPRAARRCTSSAKRCPSARAPDVVARWLLAELFAPGGAAQEGGQGRRTLRGMDVEAVALAQLGLGLDAGYTDRCPRPGSISCARCGLRGLGGPAGPLRRLVRAQKATALRHHSPDLWRRWRAFVRRPSTSPFTSAGVPEASSSTICGRRSVRCRRARRPREAPPNATAASGRCASPDPSGATRSANLVSAHPRRRRGRARAVAAVDGQVETPRRLQNPHGDVALGGRADGGGSSTRKPTWTCGRSRGAAGRAGRDRRVGGRHAELDRDPRRWGEWPRSGWRSGLERGRHGCWRLGVSATSVA